MKITLRRANNGDIHDICRIFRSAVRGLAREHYTPEQIDIWAARLSPDSVRDGVTIGCVYIAEVDGVTAGFGRIDLHSAEIAMLFVAPSYSRKGVGAALLKHMEQIAIDKGLDSLRLRASLNAFPFYKSMGYVEVEKVTHTIDNVDFNCINMRKNLAKTCTGDGEQ